MSKTFAIRQVNDGKATRFLQPSITTNNFNIKSIMDLLSNFKSAVTPDFPGDDDTITQLYDTEPYTAFSEDLEFMWRWTIYRDQKLVQEGCSLTLDASRRAVDHVLAFFSVSNRRQLQGE